MRTADKKDFKCSKCDAVYQHKWRIQKVLDAGIPVWAPKPCAQIKGKLVQNSSSYLIISSTQMHLHVARHLI